MNKGNKFNNYLKKKKHLKNKQNKNLLLFNNRLRNLIQSMAQAIQNLLIHQEC